MLFKFNQSDKLKNTIRCYPDVQFFIFNQVIEGSLEGPEPDYSVHAENLYPNSILNNKIKEGINGYKNAYVQKEINIDRDPYNQIDPYIIRDSNYDAIDGNGIYDVPIGSKVYGSYIQPKSFDSYYIISKNQVEFSSINRAYQNYRKYISGDLGNTQFNDLSLPFSATIFSRDIYGSKIKEGSIDIDIYQNGIIKSLDIPVNIDNIPKYIENDTELKICKITDLNGILHLTYCIPNGNIYRLKIGYILYEYGMLIFDDQSIFEIGNDFTFHPNFFPDLRNELNFQYDVKFKGTHDIQNLTMFCTVKKELNLSNNPTYILKGQDLFQTQSSIDSFKENERILIKNLNENKYITKNIDFIKNNGGLIDDEEYQNIIINSSSFGDDEFKKGVYISSINIYDKKKNIIAVSKLANPIRKTEDGTFIIKLQFDF